MRVCVTFITFYRSFMKGVRGSDTLPRQDNVSPYYNFGAVYCPDIEIKNIIPLCSFSPMSLGDWGRCKRGQLARIQLAI